MSEAKFEDLINDYRRQTYTHAVEDFLNAFETCGFHSDELLYALSDAFTHRGFDEIAINLSQLAEGIPLDSQGNAQFRATACLDKEESQ